jgi:hypothetical protein
VKRLPVVEGCGLTSEGLEQQLNRAQLLRASVVGVEQSPGAIRVSFAADADTALLAELVERERSCCPFLTIELEGMPRILRIASDDPARADDLRAFARLFGAAA